MELTNFKFSSDNIAVEQNDQYYDLHNCFDFTSLKYDVSKREVTFKWLKGEGDWVPEDSPSSIELIFSEVYLFKARERDSEIPYTEDDCLSVMGFIWNNLVDEMGSYCSNEPKSDCTHFSLEFMSGFAVKLGAKFAKIIVQ